LKNNNKNPGRGWRSVFSAGRVRPFVAVLLLGGCAAYPPPIPVSDGHLKSAPGGAVSPDIPPPVKASAYVPPPRPSPKPQTFSVVVNEVPAKELLFALARDSRLNVDVHPSIQGVVTLNAVNETLPAILDRLARQVNLRYKLEGNALVVMPDSPHLKTYRVNYVNVSRNTSSMIGVATQIASAGSGGATGGVAPLAGQGTGNSSNTTVSSTSSNNFWEVLGENIRNILSSTKAAKMTAEEKAARLENARATREERLQQVEAAARAGAGATNLFTTAFGTPAALQMPDSKSEVIVNPVVGSVTVLATERQHELVQQYLDGVMQAAQRQVLIEATIVEVALSDKYKAGVDWSRLASGAGFTINQQLLAGNLGTPPNITIGYANATSAVGNVSATLSLLESFGNIRVLSSPKLMALNNQTALLKVVNNVVYFSIEAQTSTTQGVATTTFNTTPHTIPVGVVMAVTPQINDNSMVTLTVRPTISRVVGFKNDPNPNLGTGATRINNPVPEVQVREMESVLQVSSGQTVILGGLMQDDVTRNRDAVPGLGGLPAVGDAFSYRDESATKTELVIFLRPTSIANPSLDSDELKFFRRYLPSSSAATTP
jgi:general secretion pathway protein D